MSQWGDRDYLFEGDTIATVLPHVTTAGFAPIGPDSIIDDILLMNVAGDQSIAVRLTQEAKAKFVGRPYSEWRK